MVGGECEDLKDIRSHILYVDMSSLVCFISKTCSCRNDEKDFSHCSFWLFLWKELRIPPSFTKFI